MATYQTVNGPKTTEEMDRELRAVGWEGPVPGTEGPGAIANAYQRTTGGGVQEVAGENYGSAAQNQMYGGVSPGPPPQQQQQQQTSALDEQFRRMLEALASGNRERFEFEKDQFNRQFEESRRQFDVGHAEQQRQFNEGQALNVGNLTGMYNGQPTEQARQFNQSMGQRQTEFGANLGTTLLNAATQLRGPRDYLQYQQFTRGGQNLMQQLYGNQPIALGAQPTGQLQSANLGTVLGDLGIGIGGGAPAANAVDPRAQLLERFGLSAGQQLNPNQVNPARWDAMGQIGRDLTKNLAETVYGYDPEDFEAQLNAQRPVGTVARATRTGYSAPRGIY